MTPPVHYHVYSIRLTHSYGGMHGHSPQEYKASIGLGLDIALFGNGKYFMYTYLYLYDRVNFENINGI